MSASKNLIQAASGVGGGDFYPYTVDNSVRFNDDDDAKMYRTHSTPTSDQKFTYSTWFKHCNVTTNAGVLFYVRNSAWNRYFAIFAYPPSGTYNGRIYISSNPNGSVQDIAPSALFRDFSAWYHLVLAVDSTQAVAADRVKVYINGERVTDWLSGTAPNNVTLNQSISPLQSGGITAIGGRDDVANVQKYDGYLSQTAYIDGTAYAATDFGESKNGVWIPKDISGLSFGNNGYYLDYTSSSAFGNDVSGNNNDLTTSGLTSSDQMIDTPTNNFATWNPLKLRDTASAYWPLESYSEGNLITTHPSGVAGGTSYSTIGVPDDTKMYAEIYVNSAPAAFSIGVDSGMYANTGDATDRYIYTNSTGSIRKGGTTVTTGSTYTAGDIIGICIDRVSDEVAFYKNGTLQGTITGAADKTFFLYVGANGGDTVTLNAGQNGTFNGNVTAGGNTDANGLGDFKYTVPTDALALCTANLPEPTIGPNSTIKPEDCFATILYTGNGTAIGSGGKVITGVGFQPDMVWIKNRDAADSWMVFDSVRGATKYLSSNSTADEATSTESLTSFDADGFTLGNHVAVNTNTEDYVAYCFKITAGFFDIQNHLGTGVATTVAHDLGEIPAFIISKAYDRGTGSNWPVYCESWPVSDPETDYQILNGTNARLDDSTFWNDTAPTSSVFSVGTNVTNLSGVNSIVYLFANVPGFCKIGYYEGNGSADGAFHYLGFSPEMSISRASSTASNWIIQDTKRNTYNPVDTPSILDGADAEYTANSQRDFVSNGLKMRATGTPINLSGQDYITLSIGTSSKYSNAR